MPIRSFAALRRWLAPWACAALALTGLIVTLGRPPIDLWFSMLASILATLLLAGCLAGLLCTGAAKVLRVPAGSRGSLGLAALSGASLPFLPVAPLVDSEAFSLVVYTALALIAAWRVTPVEAANTHAHAQALPSPARAT